VLGPHCVLSQQPEQKKEKQKLPSEKDDGASRQGSNLDEKLIHPMRISYGGGDRKKGVKGFFSPEAKNGTVEKGGGIVVQGKES